MMTDPVADMLTRIRNAVRVEKPAVEMPASGLKIDLAKVLKDEGFILDYQTGKHRKQDDGSDTFDTHAAASEAGVVLRVFLKYGQDGEKVIRRIDRVSKPGCRQYRKSKDLKPVLDGLGVAVLSTSQGLMSDRQARARKIGGEIVCTVW